MLMLMKGVGTRRVDKHVGTTFKHLTTGPTPRHGICRGLRVGNHGRCSTGMKFCPRITVMFGKMPTKRPSRSTLSVTLTLLGGGDRAKAVSGLMLSNRLADTKTCAHAFHRRKHTVMTTVPLCSRGRHHFRSAGDTRGGTLGTVRRVTGKRFRS